MTHRLTLRQFEALDGALSALLRCDLAEDRWTREYNPARLESRLLDTAMDCGMSYDEPSVRDWAAERVTRMLCAA
jgi:hypothetical protein